MGRNQIQKNEDGFNVLVETENSNNRHCYHGNFDVKTVKAVSDTDILNFFKKESYGAEALNIAKEWIKSKEGYAVSNVKDDTLDIKHGSIVAYTPKP